MSPRIYSSADLDTEVVLECDIETADGAGGTVKTAIDVDTVWIKLEAVSGREQLRGGMVETADLYRARMRYRTDVLPTWRLRRLSDGKVFDVTCRPREIERGRWQEVDLAGH